MQAPTSLSKPMSPMLQPISQLKKKHNRNATAVTKSVTSHSTAASSQHRPNSQYSVFLTRETKKDHCERSSHG
eukprot:5861029-Ditylum_brightwellii.AAC.1